jgi:hypothetical protein
MAKFIIPVEKLPPPNADGNHVFRFRVTSDDRSIKSEYSTLYSIQSAGQIYPLEVSASASIQANSIVVSWDTPSIYNYSTSAKLYKNGALSTGYSASVSHNHGTDWKVHDADIFVNWYSTTTNSYLGYEYQGRSKDNNIFITKKANTSKVKVFGQVANYPPTKNDMFKIFETSEITF